MTRHTPLSMSVTFVYDDYESRHESVCEEAVAWTMLTHFGDIVEQIPSWVGLKGIRVDVSEVNNEHAT